MSMSKKSIFYKHPQLYIWGLKWIHKSNFTKRYRHMASFVRKGDLVLEPVCGPAILADFLPEGVYYRGFDTNKEFVDYAFKKHSGVRSILHREFIKTGLIDRSWGQFYDELFDSRQRGDYIPMVKFDPEQVKHYIHQSKGFVEVMKQFVIDYCK